MKLRFGIATGRSLSAGQVMQQARLAEELGFDYLGMVDQPNLDRDVHVMMAIAAATTRRLHVGQSVTDPYSIHPWYIANATASIDEWSGGRTFIGVGAGGPFGKTMRPRPVADLREAVVFMKNFLVGDVAEFKGTRMQSEWLRRDIPIYIACEGPRSCQQAAELGNTIITARSNPVYTKWKIEQMRLGAQKAGRDPSKLDIRLTTMVYVTDKKEKSLREAAALAMAVHRTYQLLQTNTPEVADLHERLDDAAPGLIDEIKRVHDAWTPDQHERIDMPAGKAVTQRVSDFVNVTGPPEEVCERLTELGRLGVTTIECALYGMIEPLVMMKRIHDEIMPHFQR